MDTFDTSEMGNALQDVTNVHDKKAEAAVAAREKGWAEPESYDYSKYSNTLPPLPKPSDDTPDLDLPEWAANAAKYEWKDEYGDVGPENPELEEMLFRSEYINRAGLKLGKYASDAYLETYLG